MTPLLKRAAVWLLVTASALAGFVVVALAVVLLAPGALVPLVEWALAPPGGSARVAQLRVSLRPTVLEARGVEVAGWDGLEGHLRLDRVRVKLRAEAVWHGGEDTLLESLAVQGLDARVPLPSGGGEGGSPHLEILTRLFLVEELRVEDARVALALPGGELALDRFRTAIRPDGQGGRRVELEGAARFLGGGPALPAASLAGTGTITTDSTLMLELRLSPLEVRYAPIVGAVSGSLSVRLTPKRLDLEDLDLDFEPSEPLEPEEGNSRLGPSRVRLSGGLGLSGEDWNVTIRELGLGDVLTAQGRLAGPRLNSLEGWAQGQVPKAEAIGDALSFLGRPLAELRLTGSLPFSLTMEEEGGESILGLRLEPESLGVSWRPGGVEAAISGDVAATGGLAAWREGRAALRGKLEVSGSAQRLPWAVEAYRASLLLGGTLRSPSCPSVRVEVPAEQVRVGGRPLPLGAVQVDGSSVYSEEGHVRLPNVRISSSALGAWEGKVGFLPEGPSGTFSGTGVSAEAAISAAQLLGVPHADELSVRGTADVTLRVSPRMANQEAGAEVGLSTRSLAVEWAAGGVALEARGRLTALGPADRRWMDEASLSGQVALKGGWKGGEWGVRDLEISLPLGGTLAAPSFRGWTLEAPPDGVLLRGEVLPLGALSARGRFALAASGAAELEVTELAAVGLGALEGNIDWTAGEVRATVRKGSVNVRNAFPLVRLLVGTSLSGWSAEGGVDLEGRLNLSGGGIVGDGEVTFRDLGCSSPEGKLLSQGLGGTLTLAYDGSTRRVESAALTLGQGGVLWETVYLDFGQSPLELRGSGTAEGAARFEDLNVGLDLGGFGRVRLAGEVRREGRRWRPRGRISLERVQLGAAFGTFLREPLGASRPALADLEVEGTASLDLDLAQVGDATGLSGHARIEGAALGKAGEEPLLSGLMLDLPVSYRLTEEAVVKPHPPDPEDWGTLAWDRVRWGGVNVPSLRLPVALVPNELRLDGEIEIPILGGAATVRAVRIENPLSADFRGHLEVEARDLDLALLQSGAFRLQGHLGGSLAPVVVRRTQLSSGGALRGELFGGGLEIGGISVRSPLSAGREVGADLVATAMDLEALSTAFDVGRITGRLDAAVKGLRVAYGEPVAFHLRAASVPMKGVEQRVSLKAVNSISLLSTGSALGGAGLSLMTAVFKEFPYKKIGFECDLRNDVFRVQGLIREEGVEYLVKRPLFGGINVVNRNPDNTIRFSDMLRRLERLTERAGRQGPRLR